MIGSGRSVKACLEGDLDEGSFMSGQISGMIAELKSAKEIVTELVEGYERVVAGLLG
jgi:enoyl-[acyl-carrier protein] reductase II